MPPHRCLACLLMCSHTVMLICRSSCLSAQVVGSFGGCSAFAVMRLVPTATSFEGSTYRPIDIDAASVVVSGGFAGTKSNKFCLDTTTIKTERAGGDATFTRFFRVAKDMAWFRALVAGRGSGKGGSLTRLTVLDVIRERAWPLVFSTDDDVCPALAVADDGGDAADVGSADGTDAAAGLLFNMMRKRKADAVTQEKTKKAPKRLRRTNEPVMIEMRNVPECIGDSGDTVQFQVILNGRNGKSMFIELTALRWLVAYAIDEHVTQGIRHPHTEKHTTLRREPNVESAPGLWRMFHRRNGTYEFAWLKKDINGCWVADGRVRNFVLNHLADATVWERWACDGESHRGELSVWKTVARKFVDAWVQAIIAENETEFLRVNNVPQAWLVAQPDGTALAADAVEATDSEEESPADADAVSGDDDTDVDNKFPDDQCDDDGSE